MFRLLILLLLVGLSGVASAQVTDTTRTATAGTLPPVTTLAEETRVQNEAFAAWKVRYATNRSKIAQEIKAVKQEITAVEPAKGALKTQLTDLLNGTIRRWNEEKTDFANPDQFAECQQVFSTIRQAIRDGVLKL